MNLQIISATVISLIILSVTAVEENSDISIKEIPSTSPPSQSTSAIVDFILTNENVKNQSYNANNDLYTNSYKDTCKSVYIIPDYLSNEEPSYQELIATYMRLPECYNVIFCPWRSASNPDYIMAAEAVSDVGTTLGQHIIETYGNVDFKEPVECVGHGLGAHIAGVAGRTSATPVQINTIYGLSPRGDLFTDDATIFEDYKLLSSDATNVICLHTCIHGMGSSKECGQYDFYANRGAKQPGIIFDYRGYYSHNRALAYFRESLESEHFVAKWMVGFYTTRFGRFMQKNTLPGKYYFLTNAQSPFSKN